MSDLPYMPMYWGDFLSDTTHLDGIQTGIYLLLLGNMWIRRGWVPDDDEQIARMCRIDVAAWQAVKPAIRPFLILKEGRFSQKRLLDEKRKANRMVKKNRLRLENFRKGKNQQEQIFNEVSASDIKTKTKVKTKESKKEINKEKRGPVGPPPVGGTSTAELAFPKPKKPTPRDELLKVLDADHADAVLEHRSRLRRPLTDRSARLLAGKFAGTENANTAADAMIAHGWQGFEPEWVKARPNGNATGPPAEADEWEELRQKIQREETAKNVRRAGGT
jgi:uncharacterized protein YdaU (DUF1376 family)